MADPALDVHHAAATRPRRRPRRASASHGILGDLRAEHKDLRRRLRHLERAHGADEQRDGVARVSAALWAHLHVEHSVFYPAYQLAVAAEDDKRALADPARENGKDLLRRLESLRTTPPGAYDFRAHVADLRTALEGHARFVERDLFPAAARALGRTGLEDLQRGARTTRAAALEDPPVANARAAGLTQG